MYSERFRMYRFEAACCRSRKSQGGGDTHMNSLRKWALGSAALVALVSLGASTWAQDQAPPMTVVKIKNNVYWAHDPNFGQGTGSNNGFIIGKKGVILVDTKTTLPAEKVVIAEIAKVTP